MRHGGDAQLGGDEDAEAAIARREDLDGVSRAQNGGARRGGCVRAGRRCGCDGRLHRRRRERAETLLLLDLRLEQRRVRDGAVEDGRRGEAGRRQRAEGDALPVRPHPLARHALLLCDVRIPEAVEGCRVAVLERDATSGVAVASGGGAAGTWFRRR